MMIIGCTGHRSFQHNPQDMKSKVHSILYKNNPDIIISGMALGFDQLVAEVCVENGFPLLAAIPHENQDALWKKEQKEHYKYLLENCTKIHHVTHGEYSLYKLFKRNKWIVDNSSALLAYWNGRKKGGAFHTVNYATSKNVKIINVFGKVSNS